MVDEGAFINGAGETVSCRSMIIIMTSNTGAEVYRGQTIGFSPTVDLTAMDREVDRRLSETFRFEFLNRFDRVVHFHPLSRNHIRTIALRELEQLKQRVGFKQRRLFLDVDESVLSRLLPDLARAWSKQPAQVDVSRIYGKDGVIHDPRTGVTSNRIKEVWKGRLDEFLEGRFFSVFIVVSSYSHLVKLPSLSPKWVVY